MIKEEIGKALSDSPVKLVKSFFRKPKKADIVPEDKSEVVVIKKDVVVKDSINDIKHRKKVHKGPKKIVLKEKNISKSKKEEKLYVIPLGGLDEIGKKYDIISI